MNKKVKNNMDVSLKTFGFLFGAGAQIKYGLLSEGQFALDIFRVDTAVNHILNQSPSKTIKTPKNKGKKDLCGKEAYDEDYNDDNYHMPFSCEQKFFNNDNDAYDNLAQDDEEQEDAEANLEANEEQQSSKCYDNSMQSIINDYNSIDTSNNQDLVE